MDQIEEIGILDIFLQLVFRRFCIEIYIPFEQL